MSTLEEILAPQIDLTIEGLKRKRFTADPISGKYSSKITSLISRARQGGARGFGGPHPTGEPERRAEDADRSARPGRSHITQAFRSTYCDVPRIWFLGPLL